MRSAVRLRSCPRFSARLGSSGRSRDRPGTLRGSIFNAEITRFSTFVASGVHASAQPPDPYETLRGRTNFKLRARRDRPNIGRKLASNGARRSVRAGNTLDEGPEATQRANLALEIANLAPRTANWAAKTANLAAKMAQLGVPRPFQMRPGASPSRPRAPKAPKIEISSIFRRFSIDFSRIFPHCVQLSGCVKRFFFARLTAFDQQNAKKKRAAIAFVLRFAARACPYDMHDPTHNLQANVLHAAPR